MILHRYVVSRVIWAYMLSIAVTYSITLCLFPGLESEIRNPTLGEWLPILIMATFNMSDFVGKVRRTLVLLLLDPQTLDFLCCTYEGGTSHTFIIIICTLSSVTSHNLQHSSTQLPPEQTFNQP